MAIGVKDTQEIIRQAALISRNTASVPAKLDPQEVGMATGPRNRNRNLGRPEKLSDYLYLDALTTNEWQKLDDDIYKFLQLRKDQFARLGTPPSHQFLAEMESQLKFNDTEYSLGSYLGLIRQAADLDLTRETFVTSSEQGAFHAFARRLHEDKKVAEVFDPKMVKRYRDLLDSKQANTFRGLADLFRLISRAARQPLIGGIREAPSQSIIVMLSVIDLSVRFNQHSQGELEFQVGPMDVFLGARTVLFNRSVVNPTLSMIKELVLDETGLYHEDLIELLKSVGVFGSEMTMHMPESLAEEGFALQGNTYSALELIMAAGVRMAKTPGSSSKAMATLADAIVHKVQQQDKHKDQQIQGILEHFNRLLEGERRSASRVTEARQQARFDYMTAIQTASQLARGMQTGQMAALEAGDMEAKPRRESMTEGVPENVRESVVNTDLNPTRPAAEVLAGLSSVDYEKMLSGWDQILIRIRKKLTTKSSVFKQLAMQLARARSLDTSLAYGLTPQGARALGRLAKILQGEQMSIDFGITPEVAEALETAMSMDYPAFMASVESLIATLYEFKPLMQGLQFRIRDRKTVTSYVSDEMDAEVDEVVLNLILGTLLIAQELQNKSEPKTKAKAYFDADGKLLFPKAEALATLGNCDPFHTYCAFLWAGKETLMEAPLNDLETSLALMSRLTVEWREAMGHEYRKLKKETVQPSFTLSPKISEVRLPSGWEKGCERGFMSQVAQVLKHDESLMEGNLSVLLSELQNPLDYAVEFVLSEKLKRTRERVLGILN